MTLPVKLFLVKRDRQGHSWWTYKCSCGEIFVSRRDTIGRSTWSCGCYHRQRASEQGKKKKTHGLSRSPEFAAWAHAKQRCEDKHVWNYRHYGGRGIKFRLVSVLDTIKSIGYKPAPSYSIDRINNNGHYEIGNIRWATAKQQANNRRSEKCRK